MSLDENLPLLKAKLLEIRVLGFRGLGPPNVPSAIPDVLGPV